MIKEKYAHGKIFFYVKKRNIYKILGVLTDDEFAAIVMNNMQSLSKEEIEHVEQVKKEIDYEKRTSVNK